jgi:RNA polymerase sigma-B factor
VTAVLEAAPHADEGRLWELAGDGDATAREHLVERYLRLAHQLARRYARTSEPLEDLEQVACVGLLRAVDRFDLSRGTTFSTFAMPTILGELRRHLRDRTWSLRVPRELRDASSAVERMGEQLAAELGRSPSPAEVADALGQSVEHVVAAREAAMAYRCDSLDRPLRADEVEGAATVGDRLGKEDEELTRVETGIMLDQLATGSLSARDRTVLRLRFEHDLLQREIAERIGVSQMQVSRILRDALRRLQDAANDVAARRPGDVSAHPRHRRERPEREPTRPGTAMRDRTPRFVVGQRSRQATRSVHETLYATPTESAKRRIAHLTVTPDP